MKAVGFKLMYELASEDELNPANWGPMLPARIRSDIARINGYIEAQRDRYMVHLAHVWKSLGEDHELRVLHVHRKDKLAAFVSLQLALREDDWLERPYGSGQIRIDPLEFGQWCERGDILERKYGQMFAKHPTLHVEYDELAHQFGSTLEHVCRFLNVEPIQIDQPTRKQQTRDLRKVVENFDDLKRALSEPQE